MTMSQCSVSWSKAALVLFALLAGCAPAPSTKRLPTLEQNGFRLKLTSIDCEARIGNEMPSADRKIVISAWCQDWRGNRVVSFSSHLEMEEVRDENGVDLIALAAPYSYRESQGYYQYGFPPFRQRHDYEGKEKYDIYLKFALETLPYVPDRLSVMRGHAQGLLAAQLRTHDIPLVKSDAWMTLAPGLEFRIAGVRTRGSSTGFECQMRTAQVDGVLGEAQLHRWFWIEVVDETGMVRLSRSARPTGVEGSDVMRLSGSIPHQGDLEEHIVRLTVVEDLQLVRIPFEFHDIPIR
jgi:hypothetical protein